MFQYVILFHHLQHISCYIGELALEQMSPQHKARCHWKVLFQCIIVFNHLQRIGKLALEQMLP
jgi:hypothetical protein